MKINIIFLFFFGLTIGCSGQPDSANVEAGDSAVRSATEFLPPDSSSRKDSVNIRKNWHLIETQDAVVAFSKVASLGKISVFIVSTPGCQPCKYLRRQLESYDKHKDSVDYYYVNMSAGQSYKKLTKLDAFYFARYYDRLKGWPRVIITSPSGSILKAFSHDDLIRECREKVLYQMYLQSDSLSELKFRDTDFAECDSIDVYQRTVSIIERAVKEIGRFDPDKVITNIPSVQTDDQKKRKVAEAANQRAPSDSPGK